MYSFYYPMLINRRKMITYEENISNYYHNTLKINFEWPIPPINSVNKEISLKEETYWIIIYFNKQRIMTDTHYVSEQEVTKMSNFISIIKCISS